MPKVFFSRSDACLVVRPAGSGQLDMHLFAEGAEIPGTVAEWTVSAEALVAESHDWSAEFRQAFARLEPPPAAVPADVRHLPRISVATVNPEIAAFDWEKLLWPTCTALRNSFITTERGESYYLWRPPIARTSPVRLRALDLDLTLPLRVLQIDPSAALRLAEIVPPLFGASRPEQWQQGILLGECTLAECGSFQRQTWPTVEILHFDHFPMRDAALFSTATPELPGTFGWLSRLADARQTRLIVFACPDPLEAAQARRLAQRLVERGGPAVLVSDHPEPLAATFFEKFYANVIHDFPLDLGIAEALSRIDETLPLPALFAGGGREEALRVSTIGVKLLDVARAVGPSPEFSAERAAAAVEPAHVRQTIAALSARSSVALSRGLEPPSIEAMRGPLHDLDTKWDTFTFEFHESEGMLPLAHEIGALRQAAKITGPAQRVLTPAPGPRFINSAFYEHRDDEPAARLDPAETTLTPGKVCHLGIDIGPLDVAVQAIGAMPLLEEVFKWTADMPGAWVEVGVTGLDFAVLGSPVQEVWLPRHGPSERIYFAVVPQNDEVALLRFCLYFQHNVVQSFRLAALTSPVGPPRAAALLAQELDVPVEQIGRTRYRARLEYSLSPDLQEFERPPRALSIVANDRNGRPVITLKTGEDFGVRTDAELGGAVQRMRTALDEVSARDSAARPWKYAFAGSEAENTAALESALIKLADAGWELFDRITPDEEKRDKLREKLSELSSEPQIIHVAHVLLDKVIPWAALYDRKWDRDAGPENGRPVGFAACLAPLRHGLGCAGPACRAHPDCLLHASQKAARAQRGEPELREETVACPNHFWGFRHIIEVPAQQAADGQQPPAARDRVLAGSPVQMLAGTNATLVLLEPHLGDLQALLGRSSRPARLRGPFGDRQVLLRELKTDEIDLIYLYCHARKDDRDQLLVFQKEETSPEGFIRPSALDESHVWPHHPLVILNGCGTVGGSPQALSRFIPKFVQRRGASGVLGTEAPVWEELAVEMGQFFLERFLSGRSAGVALLEARQTLLRKFNPLGLNYTLYSVAELALANPTPAAE